MSHWRRSEEEKAQSGSIISRFGGKRYFRGISDSRGGLDTRGEAMEKFEKYCEEKGLTVFETLPLTNWMVVAELSHVRYGFNLTAVDDPCHFWYGCVKKYG